MADRNSPDSTDIDGPQDCGPFFLDAVGPYGPSQVRATWREEVRPTAAQVEEAIDVFWQRHTARAKAEGFGLWDGPLCRLIEYHAGPDGLVLVLGPTCYRDFLGTNLYNAHFRYTHGPEVLASPVGVSAIVMIQSQYLLLGRRSKVVAYHPDRIHPFGGCAEPAAGPGAADMFESVAAELREEVGLAAEQVHQPVCLGLVRDKHIVQPELLFDVPVSASVDEIRMAVTEAVNSAEHTDILIVRDHPASVVNFMQLKLAELTPVALAGLLLHGLHAWGSGWFASTRGYLRTLI